MATCVMAMCDRPVKARRLCSRHYEYEYTHGTLDNYPVRRDLPFIPVCVCPTPDTDGLGECRHCHMGYTPGLMATRNTWIEYLDSKGVERGAGIFLVNS